MYIYIHTYMYTYLYIYMRTHIQMYIIRMSIKLCIAGSAHPKPETDFTGQLAHLSIAAPPGTQWEGSEKPGFRVWELRI